MPLTTSKKYHNVFFDDGIIDGEALNPPGWYFSDETDGLNGPYETEEEAKKQFDLYCEMYL